MRWCVGRSGTPSFSASTTSAASVGAPTARNIPSLHSIRASLQTAHTSAMACDHAKCTLGPWRSLFGLLEHPRLALYLVLMADGAHLPYGLHS